jgi:hypothetical protein
MVEGPAAKGHSTTAIQVSLAKESHSGAGLNGRKQITGLQRIQISEEVSQFVELWLLLRQFQLLERDDEITWRFTSNGHYTSKLAYNMQFVGSFVDFNWARLWSSKVEKKCQFFCWLLIQNKAWTADRIARFGGQTNTVCQLCRTQQETAIHIVASCSYSQSVWTALASWIGVSVGMPPSLDFGRLKVWWRSELKEGNPSKEETAARLQKMIYTCWNIWKE